MGGKGEGVFRNMYEGHMDKTKGGGFEGERQEWVRQGGTWWGENGGKCT